MSSARGGGITVGIDASRSRSGGAIRHLVGILGAGDPRDHGVREVHVWSYDRLLRALPDAPWLIKHHPTEIEGSLARQILWQRRRLPAEAQKAGVDILLNTDAGTVCRARPSVTMSRDMLSYEPGEMARYGMSKMWLRLQALKYVQARSLRHSDGAIFLTRYAADVIQKFTGCLPMVAVIPHGMHADFRQTSRRAPTGPWQLLYTSQADLYKHQWWVVRAVRILRDRGYDLQLTLAGGGEGRAQRRLDDEVRRSDPNGEFVTQIGAVPPNDLPALLGRSDMFIFASSCENMPNTLLEAMASALPIACAERGPMPEVLRDGGVYFDPDNPDSIAAAVERLLKDPAMRESMAIRARALSDEYSWERCAAETWRFLRETLEATRPGAASSERSLTTTT